VKAVNPGLPEGALEMVLRAEALLLHEDRQGAREAFEKASTLAPKSTVLLLLVADLEEKAEAYDAAIARYRRVLELQPANVVALNNLAYALAARRGQPAEGLPDARKAASLSMEGFALLARVHRTQDRLSEITSEFDAVAQKRRRNVAKRTSRCGHNSTIRFSRSVSFVESTDWNL
jgi:tetratricopeptide (TPR) repeat protein